MSIVLLEEIVVSDDMDVLGYVRTLGVSPNWRIVPSQMHVSILSFSAVSPEAVTGLDCIYREWINVILNGGETLAKIVLYLYLNEIWHTLKYQHTTTAPLRVVDTHLYMCETYVLGFKY